MSGHQKIQHRINELEAKLRAAESAQERVDIMNALSRELFVYEMDRSMRYAYDARKLAKGIGYSRGIAVSLTNEALCCRIKSDFKRSKQVASEALAIFEAIADKQGQAD